MPLKNKIVSRDSLSKPLVSICCMTYNHENYIRQCLDGFVNQQTTFPFEILVHEDSSPDNTAKILKEYEIKFSKLFRCIYQTENQFAKQNTLVNILFPMSRGKYIALCEGDDYWTDPYKLQKHVDFLDAHYECAMSYNRALTYLQSTEIFKLDNTDINTGYNYITAQNLASGNCIGNFSTCVYRKSIIEQLKPEIYDMNIADWMFNLCVAQFGLIGQLGEIMSVYRIHDKGEWSKKSRLLKLKTENDVAQEYDAYFGYKYHQEFLFLEKYIESEINRLTGKHTLTKQVLKKHCPPVIWWLIRIFYPKNLL